MIVELFGLPGAGKTTLVKALTGSTIGATRADFAMSRSGVVRYITRHPVATAAWFKDVVSEASRVGYWAMVPFKLRLLANTFSKVESARSAGFPAGSSGDVHWTVVDEGLLQRVLSVYETVQSQRKLRAIVRRALPSSTRVVLVEGGGDPFWRYRDAKNVRTRLGDDYLRRWFEVVRTNYDGLAREIEAAEVPCCRIRTDQPVDESLNELVRFLERQQGHKEV